MSDSFAGITVPEGEPGTMREAATTFRTAAAGLQGVSGDLHGMPALVGDWDGPASAAYRGSTATNGTAVDGAIDAMVACEQALTVYADQLEAAQDEARAAIAQARDAQSRIDAAEADIAAAQTAQSNASAAVDAASTRIATSGATGIPDPTAGADLDAASADLAAAEGAEADARQRLVQAQDDLERAKTRGNRAEQDARDAARAAAGGLDGVAGGSVAAAVYGGPPSAVAGQVLARVRSGDYSVLDELPLSYLPHETQRDIAAEVADDAQQAIYGEGDHSFEEMSAIVDRYQNDEEFAGGFYNHLGGEGARQLATDFAVFRAPGDEGVFSDEYAAEMAPFAGLLATATAARGANALRPGFTNSFLYRDSPVGDRLPTHVHMKTFVMAASADRYDPDFLSEVGEELLIAPQDPTDETAPAFAEMSEHQDFMDYMAGNPEAAGDLLAGKHGPDDHFSNADAMLRYGRWSDDGEALGSLIESGTHDLRSTDLDLANDAAHAVIQAAPGNEGAIPDGAKGSLVTILDDHIVDFEYQAVEQAQPGSVERPSNMISGLTYDESFDYLKMLVGDDATREGATTVVGDRVGEDIFRAADQQDTSYARRGGALSEMSVLATAEANLDSAESADAMNNIAKTASGQIIGLTPPGRIPLSGPVFDQLLGEVFSTDAVQHALEEQGPAQVNAEQHISRLAIAAQVQSGDLPPQAMDMLELDGSVNPNFVDGPNEDQDVIPGLEFDLDRDGTISAGEREITERELYDASTGIAEPANEAMRALQETQWAADNPPDIDELSVPDSLDNNNPSTFEEVWEWPFDAEGEGTVHASDGGDVVAEQDDLRWDADEKVYVMDVEGHEDLYYKRVEDEWKRVVQVNGEWQLAD